MISIWRRVGKLLEVFDVDFIIVSVGRYWVFKYDMGSLDVDVVFGMRYWQNVQEVDGNVELYLEKFKFFKG